MKKKKTVFITGGGTGGHIYPAVAVYNALKGHDINLFYVGNKNRLEFDICKNNGFNFLSVEIEGMPRKVSPELILFAFKLFFAILKACFYFLKYKPDVVFATGGYVSAPSLFACKIFQVPYMLHDCDSVTGIVTRFFASGAKRISLAFECAKRSLNNENIYLNGNPIRTEFSAISKEAARNELKIPNDDFAILVMGGSQGAKSINTAALTLIEKFKNTDGITLIIQTGAKNYAEFMKSVDLSDVQNIIVKPYFEKMYIPLIACDLAVSRAGSLSLSELCASNSASILVPYPFASQNHQKTNAEEMGNSSIIIEDKDLTGEKLYEIIDDLIKNNYKVRDMQKAACALAKPRATEEIKLQILDILGEI